MKIGRLAEIMAVKYKVASYDMAESGWLIFPNGEIKATDDHAVDAAKHYNFEKVGKDWYHEASAALNRLVKDGGIVIRRYRDKYIFTSGHIDQRYLSNVRDFISKIGLLGDQKIWLQEYGSFSPDADPRSEIMTVDEFLSANDPKDVEPERDYTTKWARLAAKYKAASYDMVQYGWWIWPDGTIEEVDNHNDAAQIHCDPNHQYKYDGGAAKHRLWKDGGVSVRSYGSFLHLITDRLDSRCIDNIRGFFEEKHVTPDQKIHISNSSNKGNNGKSMTAGEFLSANDPSDVEPERDYTTKWASINIGTTLRSRITNLSNIINKTHGILRECADSDAKNPKNEREVSAVEGFEFIKKVVGMIDYLDALKDHQSPESLKDIYLAALILKETIEKNLATKHEGRDVQFPHVSDLIWEMKPLAGKKWDDFRKYESAKARSGLARIMSIAIDMLKDLKDAGIDVGFGKVEDEDRFKPQRAELSSQEIIPFLLEYGPEYGIDNTDEWMKVLESDKGLKSKLTTIINALNRGHSPVDSNGAKKQIREILEGYRAGRREPIGEPKIGAVYLNALVKKYIREEANYQ
jgi:hypothetical protein